MRPPRSDVRRTGGELGHGPGWPTHGTRRCSAWLARGCSTAALRHTWHTCCFAAAARHRVPRTLSNKQGQPLEYDMRPAAASAAPAAGSAETGDPAQGGLTTWSGGRSWMLPHAVRTAASSHFPGLAELPVPSFMHSSAACLAGSCGIGNTAYIKMMHTSKSTQQH